MVAGRRQLLLHRRAVRKVVAWRQLAQVVGVLLPTNGASLADPGRGPGLVWHCHPLTVQTSGSTWSPRPRNAAGAGDRRTGPEPDLTYPAAA